MRRDLHAQKINYMLSTTPHLRAQLFTFQCKGALYCGYLEHILFESNATYSIAFQQADGGSCVLDGIDTEEFDQVILAKIEANLTLGDRFKRLLRDIGD